MRISESAPNQNVAGTTPSAHSLYCLIVSDLCLGNVGFASGVSGWCLQCPTVSGLSDFLPQCPFVFAVCDTRDSRTKRYVLCAAQEKLGARYHA